MYKKENEPPATKAMFTHIITITRSNALIGHYTNVSNIHLIYKQYVEVEKWMMKHVIHLLRQDSDCHQMIWNIWAWCKTPYNDYVQSNRDIYCRKGSWNIDSYISSRNISNVFKFVNHLYKGNILHIWLLNVIFQEKYHDNFSNPAIISTKVNIYNIFP